VDKPKPRQIMTCNQIFGSPTGVHDWFQKVAALVAFLNLGEFCLMMGG